MANTTPNSIIKVGGLVSGTDSCYGQIQASGLIHHVVKSNEPGEVVKVSLCMVKQIFKSQATVH